MFTVIDQPPVRYVSLTAVQTSPEIVKKKIYNTLNKRKFNRMNGKVNMKMR